MAAAGRVGKLFGARGELTLSLYDDFPRDLNMEEPVFVKIDSHTVPLFFERFSRRGTRSATALFADIDTEARASELVGLEFSFRPGAIEGEADDAQLFFDDLVGWEADLGDGVRGTIAGFIDSAFNPLLEIGLDGRTELVPAHEEFIVEVDERRRRVVFSLPEGLLGLNR